jgi:hypothetical protein
MMGNRTAEVREDQRAEAFGLRKWGLFLNQGLAEFEKGDPDAATHSLRRAVLVGGKPFESHFNLALVYEQLGLLADAERQMLASLRLHPEQPDALNLPGVIYAEEEKTARAASHGVSWCARRQTTTRRSRNSGYWATKSMSPLRRPAVEAIRHERRPHLLASAIRRTSAQSSGE